MNQGRKHIVRGLQPYRWCLGPWNSKKNKRGTKNPPSPSTSTPSNKSRGQKTKLRRGEHGRHKVETTKDVHVILSVGPEGNPLTPPEVLAKFSN
jgi:hypothetical protein